MRVVKDSFISTTSTFRSQLQMTLNFTPQGLPVFTLETLPLVQWAAVIVEDNSSKLWKNCQNCLVSPSSLGRRAFPRCEACARVRSADPARYCVSLSTCDQFECMTSLTDYLNRAKHANENIGTITPHFATETTSLIKIYGIHSHLTKRISL